MGLAWRGSKWHGLVRQERTGEGGAAGPGGVWQSRNGLLRQGWTGRFWNDGSRQERWVKARPGWGAFGWVRRGKDGQVWRFMASLGSARTGTAWQARTGWAWTGTVGLGRKGKVWRGVTGSAEYWRDMAGKVWRGESWRVGQ